MCYPVYSAPTTGLGRMLLTIFGDFKDFSCLVDVVAAWIWFNMAAKPANHAYRAPAALGYRRLRQGAPRIRATIKSDARYISCREQRKNHKWGQI